MSSTGTRADSAPGNANVVIPACHPPSRRARISWGTPACRHGHPRRHPLRRTARKRDVIQTRQEKMGYANIKIVGCGGAGNNTINLQLSNSGGGSGRIYEANITLTKV